MRRFALVVICLAVVVAGLAGEAAASDGTVRATFVAGVHSFVSQKLPKSNTVAAEKARAESATITVLRTKLVVDSATSPKAKLGRALAIQAFAKLIEALNADAALYTSLANGGSIFSWPGAKAEARYVAALDDARRLIAAAAKSLGVKFSK